MEDVLAYRYSRDAWTAVWQGGDDRVDDESLGSQRHMVMSFRDLARAKGNRNAVVAMREMRNEETGRSFETHFFV